MKLYYQIIFVLFALFIIKGNTTTVKDFTGGAFTIKPRDGLYYIDIGMDNFETGGDLLSSFGDFNGDKYTDIVTLTNDNKTAKIYLWNDDAGAFRIYTNITMTESIVSIISADVDDNGDLDLLITSDPANGQSFTLYFFQQNRAQGVFTQITSINISRNHPSIVDVDGDHRIDVLYLDPITNIRSIAKYLSDNSTFQSVSFQSFVSISTNCLAYPSRTFSSIHYNSFVDLNGDCRADIFITSFENGNTYYEFWIKQSDGTFCLVNETQASNPNLKGVTFSDIDFDGGIDMIVATEDSEGLWFEMIFNNMPAGTDNMCSINTNTQKNNPLAITAQNYFKYKLTDNFNSNMRIYSLNSNVPSNLRIGDIDADTFPDLLITLYDSTIKSNISPKSYLFKNQDCSQEFCQESSHKRYFRYGVNAYNDILEQANNSIFAAFMDIGEMGSLDIVLGSVNSESSLYQIQAIFNYLNPDTFFLKALGLNGFSVGSTGGIYYGSTFQCVITTLDGDQKLSNYVQLFQSAYNALQLPYAFIGLGRTNNYVENFYLGMPQTDSFTKSWTPIIPNSQLIVYPTTEDPDNWTIDIYVNPTKATIIVVISTASILVIIGIVILYLHKKEKEEDKTYQEQFQQFFR